MNWLTPMYAAYAAAIAVPALLILYFLKLRRRDVEVSTTLLWKRAIQDLQANAPFQRLRRNILLLLQLLILAAVIAALAQPQMNARTISGERHIILIDRSASMATTDIDDGRGGRMSRLDAAKRDAEILIDSLREPGLIHKDRGDQAMVIAFDATASVVEQFSGDRDRLKSAVRGIELVESGTSLEDAVRLARAQAPRMMVEGMVIEGLSDRWPVTMHLFTDGKIPDAMRAKPGPEDTIIYHRAGDPKTGNIAVSALRADREYGNPNNLTLFVALQSTFPEERTIEVELIIDGLTAAIREVTLPAAATPDGLGAPQPAPDESTATPTPNPAAARRPGTGGVRFEMQRADGAVVQARLRSSSGGEIDEFPLDNRGWLIVPPAKRLAVAFVSKGNVFLEQWFADLPLAKFTTLKPEEFDAAFAAGRLAEFDVVVLDNFVPSHRGQAGTLPPGRYLVMGGVPNAVDPATLPAAGSENVALLGPVVVDQGRGGPASIVDWNREHRVLRYVNLDRLNIFVSRTVVVPPGSTALALASATNGPAVLELNMPDARAIVVPFDVAETDWPFDVSFVVFLVSSLEYLGGDGGAAAARMLRPGETVQDRLPPGAGNAAAIFPGGERAPITPAADGLITFGPLDRLGVYQVVWDGPLGPTDSRDDGRSSRWYAANLLDPAESDVAAAEQLELATSQVRAEETGRAQQVERVWPWLLLAALAVIMLEWFVYNRKVHV